MSYRFLLDENVPKSVYRFLRSRDYYAEYVPKGSSDDEVIRIAREKDLILITRDSDFADEVAYPPGSHPGIIVLRIHPSLPKIIVDKLSEVLQFNLEINGKIIVVYNDRIEIIC